MGAPLQERVALMDMEPEAVWEPWQPEVGQRVRIRLSGECPIEYRHAEAGYDRIRKVIEPVGHNPDESGRVGTVSAVQREERGGHYYMVDYDRLLWQDDMWWAGAVYAAIELEPLAAQGERAGAD